MSRLLSVLLLALILPSADLAFAAKSKVVVEPKSIIGDLRMHQKIVITAGDVTSKRDKTFKLATFCTYTNRKNGRVGIKVSNNERKLSVIGRDGEGEIPYILKINNVKVKYGNNIVRVDTHDRPTNCKTKEEVMITFSGQSIARATAGEYRASLDLTVYELS